MRETKRPMLPYKMNGSNGEPGSGKFLLVPPDPPTEASFPFSSKMGLASL